MTRRVGPFVYGFGVDPPQEVVRQELVAVPQAGHAAFLAVLRQAHGAAKQKVVDLAGRARERPESDKDRKTTERIAKWFVFEVLIGSLVEGADATGVSARTVTTLADPWPPFTILAAWSRREAESTRSLTFGLPHAADGSMQVDLSERARQRVSVRRRARLVKAYRAARSGNRLDASKVSELRGNWPLGEVHRHVKEWLRHVPGRRRGPFYSTVATKAALHLGKLTALPAEQKISMCLALRLDLLPYTPVYTADLDFVVEPLSRDLVLSTKLGAVCNWLMTADADALVRFGAAASEAYAFGLAGDLWTLLTMGTSGPMGGIPAHLHQRALDVVAERKEQLLDLARLPRAQLQPLAREFCRSCADEILRRVEADAPTEWNLDVARSLCVAEGQEDVALTHALLHGLPAAELEGLLRDVGADALELTRVVDERFAERRYRVAFHIAPARRPAARDSDGGSVRSEAAVLAEWGAGRPAPAAEADRLVLDAGLVSARDPQDALRRRVDHAGVVLDLVAFLAANPGVADVERKGWVQDVETGRVTLQRSQGLSVRPQLDQAGELTRYGEALHRLLCSAPQRDLASRILRGVHLYSKAVQSERSADQYGMLWMALEATLMGLQSDIAPRITPTGVQVAFRTALLLPPPSFAAGVVHDSLRWGLATELYELYSLRNSIVHEGLQDPPIDELLLDRFRAMVRQVLWTLVLNGLRYGLRSVEEMMAWLEQRYPPNTVVQ